jgi:hypothetical protein
MTRLKIRWAALAGGAALLSMGCASTGRLGQFDFRDRALAVVLTAPPRPDVFTNGIFDAAAPGRTWAERVISVSAEILKESQVGKVRERLDQAVDSVDVASIVGDRTLRQASRILRMRAVRSIEEADFELEVRIHEYGIRAHDWDAQPSFFVDAEVLLLESSDGSLVWRADVNEHQPLTPETIGLHPAAADVLTAGAFASLTTDQIIRALQGLAEYSADRASDKLRRSYDKARR